MSNIIIKQYSIFRFLNQELKVGLTKNSKIFKCQYLKMFVLSLSCSSYLYKNIIKFIYCYIAMVNNRQTCQMNLGLLLLR